APRGLLERPTFGLFPHLPLRLKLRGSLRGLANLLLLVSPLVRRAALPLGPPRFGHEVVQDMRFSQREVLFRWRQGEQVVRYRIPEMPPRLGALGIGQRQFGCRGSVRTLDSLPRWRD